MEIPTSFDKEILATPETAMLWLAIETMRFVEDIDSKIVIDPVTDKYMQALSSALIASTGAFVDNDGVIEDLNGMVNMLMKGALAIMGMGYMLGYRKSKEEITVK